MITEEAKELAQMEKLENGIRLCNEALAKAEKYERLDEKKDWKEYLGDLKILAEVHDREILMAISQMDEAPNTTYFRPTEDGGRTVSSKLDWVDFIRNHKIRADQCREWIREPGHVIALAKQARDTLPVLKEKLAELKSHYAETKGNGAS